MGGDVLKPITRWLESLAFQVGCPIATWVAAGSLAVGALGQMGVFGGGKQQQQDQAAGASAHYYDTLANISQDEYDTWKNEGLPLLQSLKTQATTDRTAQESEFAAGATKDAFTNARATAMRDLNMTPGGTGSDRAAAILGPSYMDEAGAVSQALTGVRRNEQARQFNQGMQVTDVYRGFPGQATSGLNAAAGGENALARTYGNMSAANAGAWGQLGYSGAVLGPQVSRWFANNNNSTIVPGYSSGDQQDFSAGYYKKGGVVRYADGGGVIRGPGTGTSDSIKARSRPGSYILSADTVRAIGHKKVHDLIEKAGVRPGEGATSYNGVPVRVSNGEAEIPPEAVRYHGEEFFNKLQQKYHRPVMDDDDGHANGGAIRKRGLPRSVEDAIYRAMPNVAIGRRA